MWYVTSTKKSGLLTTPTIPLKWISCGPGLSEEGRKDIQ